MTNIGFIGLGIMGRHMGRHLQAAGHALFVLRHRSPLPSEVMDGGATECASAREVAEKAEVIVTIVPDTPDVEAVLFGLNGVAAGLTAGKLVIDMSTISPVATKDFAARIEALGCQYLDAPVSGGDLGAQAATLSIMVGGPADALERARPLFEVMGQRITHVGEVNGAGQTCKAANQIAVAVTQQAVAEALTFAEKAGIDTAVVREALLGGVAASRVLEVHGQRMIDGAYDPGFMVKLHRKDLTIVHETAESLGLTLEATEIVRHHYDTLMEQGQGDRDTAVIKTILSS